MPEAPPNPSAPSRAKLYRLLTPLRAAWHAGRRSPGRMTAALLSLAVIVFLGWHFARQAWAASRFRAAQRAVTQFRYDEAKDHLLICNAFWPNDADVLLLAARVARRLGNYDEADRFLDRYFQRRGDDDDLTLERMLLRAEKGDLDAVNPFCFALIQRAHPQAPLILEALVAANLRLLRFPDAAAAVSIWLERAPEQAQPWHWRGYLHDLQAHTQDAIENYRKAVALDPDHIDARHRLAGNLLDLAQASEAMPHLEHVLQLRPHHAGARVELARCLDQLGRQDDAGQTLDAVLAEHPDYQPALQQRGVLALRLGQPAQAEAWLRRACELAPGNTQAHYQYSLCLQRLGKTDESRAVQEQLKQIEADQKRLTEIVGARLPKTPNDPDLLCEVGKLSLRIGTVADGLRWFEAALRLNPRHGPTHEALVAYYRATGQLGRAAKHLEFVPGTP